MFTDFSTILKRHLRYSATIIYIAWFALVMCLMFFIPQLKEIYSGIRVEIPKLTTTILQLSYFMNDWWFLLLPIAIGLPIVIFKALLTESGRVILAPYLVRIPILSAIYQEYLLISFLRTWSATLKEGCNSVETLTIAYSKSATQVDLSIIQTFLKFNVAIQDSMSNPDPSELYTLLKMHEAKAVVKANKIRDIIEAIAVVSLCLATGTAVLSIFIPLLALIKAT